MFPIEKCQKISLSQGAIYLGPSNKKQSVGYLELNPHTSLALHNRPAIEKLTQVKGIFSMVIFDEEKGKVVTMNEGDYLEIKPKNTWHIHVNPSNEVALQYWDFDGDITDIIENIRTSGD
jgi:quercetin dioxygenase-like cupin family protein